MNTNSTWERQENEPVLWFQRFQRFLAMGPDRSVLAFYNHWRQEKAKKSKAKFTPANSPPSAWTKAAQRYNWRQRASAYDLHQLKQEFADLEARVLERRKKRLELQDKLMEKIEKALSDLNTQDIRIGAAVAALRTLSEQQRIDLDDTPQQRGNQDASTGITNIQVVISGDVYNDAVSD